MPVYKLFALLGDSNNSTGEKKATNGADDAGDRIYQFNQSNQIVQVTAEPLAHVGVAFNATVIGPYVAFGRLLRDRGWLGETERILFVPCGQGGSNFVGGVNHGWSNLDSPNGIPGISLDAAVTRMNAALTAAQLSDPASRAEAIIWNSGANDRASFMINASMAPYAEQHQAMYDYIMANCPGWQYNVRWLEVPAPWEYTVDTALAYEYDGQNAYKQAIEDHIDHAKYIDTFAAPTLYTLTSEASGFLPDGNHYCAAAHRGSVGDNDVTANIRNAQTYTVDESLAGRLYAGFFAARRKKTMKWNT